MTSAKKDPYMILGVDKNVTDKELKNVYRKLSKIYHPDLNLGNKDAEEKEKEITCAYTEIKQRREERKIKNFKKDKMNELSNYFDQNDNSKDLNRIRKVITRINSFIYYSNSKEEINNLFNKGKEEIKKFYDKYITKCFKENEIPESYVNDNILINFPNYDWSYKELKKQLNIKINDYLKVRNNWIDVATTKYKSYPGYDYLDNEIEKIKKKYFSAKLSENQKKLMIQEIESIFNIYYKNMAKLKDLTDVLMDEDCLMLFDDLQKNILADNFEEIYQILIEKIIKYENKEYYQENLESMNALQQRINKKAGSIYINQGIVYDEKASQFLIKIHLYVLKLVEKAKMGIINPESLFLLENLSFLNPVEDANIIQAVESNLTFLPDNNIYLNQDDSNCSLNWLTFRDGNYYMNSIYLNNREKKLKIKAEKVNLEKINEKYILLDEIMYQARFVGMEVKSKYDMNITTILYEYGVFEIVNQKFSNLIYIRKKGNYEYSKESTNIEEFKNRDYVRDLIAKPINSWQENQKKRRIYS